MKKHKSVCAALSVIILGSLAMNGETLPTKMILGKEYYVYVIKKGDSLYGISHRYGWDQEELLKLNPELADGMKRGETIYYPTDGETASESTGDRGNSTSAETSAQTEPMQTKAEPIRHLVVRGETPYSVAKRYNIPLETLYKLHPSARKGLKAGETIVIDQELAGLGKDTGFFFAEVKRGDTLFALSRANGLTVEDILRSNPGLTERNLQAGTTIRIPVIQEDRKSIEIVEKEQVASISSYKVQKDDTWTAISRKTGVDVEDLREANPDTPKLKKNEVIAVPVIEKIEVEEEVAYNDPRDMNPEGRQEIYDSIHHIDADTRGARIALILDDPSARRDAEFARGILMALKEMGNPGYPVDFKLISGAEALDNVVASLDDFRPQAIVNISDKGVQDWLVKYGNSNGVETINAFDARTDTYLSEPSVIQVMTPSDNFYSLVTTEIGRRFPGYKGIVVSLADAAADPVCEAAAAGLPSSKLTRSVPDGLTASHFDAGGDYVIFADLGDKEEIENLFQKLEAIRNETPGCRTTVVGRPSWVMWADQLTEDFYKNNVIIPTRFFFSPEETEIKDFIDRYSGLYGRGPLKSYPNYAASGYDIANFFIPTLAANAGDFNQPASAVKSLQMPLGVTRVSNWGGFFNPACLFVEFTPYRSVERRVLK